MRRGFVISLDAMFALLVAGVLLGGAAWFAARPAPDGWERADLRAHSAGLLAAMEDSGALARAVAGNSSEAHIFIDSTPTHWCGQLLIYNSTGSEIGALTKSDCQVSEEWVQSRRSFAIVDVNATFYSAVLRSWVKP